MGDRDPVWTTVQALAHVLGVNCLALQTWEPPAADAPPVETPAKKSKGRGKK
jgi:hypothetical protein